MTSPGFKVFSAPQSPQTYVTPRFAAPGCIVLLARWAGWPLKATRLLQSLSRLFLKVVALPGKQSTVRGEAGPAGDTCGRSPWTTGVQRCPQIVRCLAYLRLITVRMTQGTE